ncbi:MAG: UDP-N-acetylmuramoyl-L-alanine--D-glutamate ligase [Pseudomonadales bacterium]
MSVIASDQFKIVVGLGTTGYSCAQYLAERGEHFAVVDTREMPPMLEALNTHYPEVQVHLGPLDAKVLSRASEIVLSPGIAKDTPAIAAAVAAGADLVGDIDLFCRAVEAPVVAITGSNAKTTVTTLLGEMASKGGIDVGVGGNIGTPVLEFLQQPPKAMYILELSSFQLELTSQLNASVAAVLNITPDHLDRYDNDFQQYYTAKHRIFKGCRSVAENLDDPLSQPLINTDVSKVGYRMGVSDFNIFGLLIRDGEEYLALAREPLMKVSELKMLGRHNVQNALSALAIGYLAGIDMAAMLDVLSRFSGIEHRCEWVCDYDGVDYFNDSKGTNVGATVAAIEGLGSRDGQKQLLLIAGGDGKGADFSALRAPIAQYVTHLILIGTDASRIAQIADEVDVHFASSMEEAVALSATLAKEGDKVLLSPACASFDMFSNYEARGHAFKSAVGGLSAA